MTRIYKTAEGARLVREQYLALLADWPVAHQPIRIATGQGETFVVGFGAEGAPPLLLLHGSAGNSAMWMSEARAFAERFRVYAVDVIGEAGLSAPSRPPLASDAYAVWLDELLAGLGVHRASVVGVSLGGWLALDYALRRPERVERIAVLCPGGIGRQKFGIVLSAIVLRMCGGWGKRRLLRRIFGRAPAAPVPGAKRFFELLTLVHQHFRPRMTKLPIFPDDALRALEARVLVIVGGRDVFLDSRGTRTRLERLAPDVEVVYLPEAGHFIPDQTRRVIEFCAGAQTSKSW
jgi:pimeloyl-ACP methyl ester carboxylesterase